jgi:hypothetical protein
MSAKKVYFDTIRTLAFGSILATYVAVGTALTVEPRIICITNDTDAGMIFSDDPDVAPGKIYIPKGTSRMFNFTANMVPEHDDSFVMAKGTIFYVKRTAAVGSGAVYIECVYGII